MNLFCSIIYKRRQYYIYTKGAKYFATTSPYNQSKPVYNLDKESEVARYWLEVGFALRLEAVDLEELHVPEQRSVMVKDTVASLRLDNVISSAFSVSRAKAADAIRSGLVFVNSIQSEKPDMQVDEGAKLVLRGKGKASLREVGGRTRKDRIFIAIERFV